MIFTDLIYFFRLRRGGGSTGKTGKRRSLRFYSLYFILFYIKLQIECVGFVQSIKHVCRPLRLHKHCHKYLIEKLRNYTKTGPNPDSPKWPLIVWFVFRFSLGFYIYNSFFYVWFKSYGNVKWLIAKAWIYLVVDFHQGGDALYTPS